MESMRDMEKLLGRAARADVSEAVAGATGALAERAAHEHLLDVAYTTLDSPVGPVLVAATRRGIVKE